ncbi:argonaute/piwi family protein [Actinomadura gamaensis]|uniref:Protein argonaute n=1 Tax=Actinomadura gamaensis TaxID=1763541 RepID=A0ABV9UDV3_9ACTN
MTAVFALPMRLASPRSMRIEPGSREARTTSRMCSPFSRGGRHAHILEALAEAKFGLLGADGRLQRVTAFAKKLRESVPMTIAAGLSVDIGLPIGSPAAPAQAPKVRSARFDEPSFVFDPGLDKTDRNAERGLTKYGPFDSQSFSPRTPRVVVLTPQEYQGHVDTFMDQFRRGVPGGKVYPQGFVRKYQLAACDITIHAFDAGPRDADSYRNACRDLTRNLGKPDLAIVITSKEQQFLHGDQSPYLVAKATLMNQGIVVQEIQIETIRKGNLDYSLDSIALQCYAKIGGIPFVIAAPQTITHEIIIGIGSAHVKPSRFSPPERIVGITTVFNADGSYILSNTSHETDYEWYPEELLHALRSCIEAVKKRNAWRADDAIRLIFHVFKPLKDTEAEAVKRLVKGLLTEFRAVEFAFVHISETHDWALFDTAALGGHKQRMPSGRLVPKGRSVPQRGHTVSISASEVLLTVTGPFDLKVATQGLPRPLLLKLHRASTFTDIDYLAGQVFRLTALSWRRFYPSGKPITVMYSDLIASLLGQLRHVRNWNADVVSTNFRTSKWFL